MSPCPDRRSCGCLRPGSRRLPARRRAVLDALAFAHVFLLAFSLCITRACLCPGASCLVAGSVLSRRVPAGMKRQGWGAADRSLVGSDARMHAKRLPSLWRTYPIVIRGGGESRLSYGGGWRAGACWRKASSTHLLRASSSSPQTARQRLCRRASPLVPTPAPDPGAGQGRKRFNGDRIALAVLIA